MTQALADYTSGMPSAAVGAKYGIDPKTVVTNLHARGGTPRPACRQTVITGDKLEEAIQLRSQGGTYSQIGEYFGGREPSPLNLLPGFSSA
jgi:hypothetical protein